MAATFTFASVAIARRESFSIPLSYKSFSVVLNIRDFVLSILFLAIFGRRFKQCLNQCLESIWGSVKYYLLFFIDMPMEPCT